MTTRNIVWASAVLLAFAPASFAQQPPSPPRTVTLPLAEYNRLVDLANRPTPPPPPLPVGAVVGSADLRIRVERDTVRGVFGLSGNVYKPGINRVTLVTGATLLDGTAAGRPVPLLA